MIKTKRKLARVRAATWSSTAFYLTHPAVIVTELLKCPDCVVVMLSRWQMIRRIEI